MKEVILKFKIENSDDEAEAVRALRAEKVFNCLWQISQEIFRPARKHGYSDPQIQAALEGSNGAHLVGLLEDRFYEILREHDIDVNP